MSLWVPWVVAFMGVSGESGGPARIVGDGAPLRPVPFHAVHLEDSFWSPRVERIGAITVPHNLAQCEATGRLANFEAAGASLADRRAGGANVGTRRSVGYFFNDSDVYKVIEGAAYALTLRPDAALEAECDRVIGLIASAQEPDGYLYTSRTILDPSNMPPGGAERWSNMEFGHELYCAGHLYEAAIAYHAATGKRTLLDVAIRNADLVASVFGPGRRETPCGHPEIELALVRLAEATDRPEYLELAAFFLGARGRGERHRYGEYSQDHAPILEQSSVVGHAVRAAYLYAGLTDVGMRTGDAAMIEASARLWQDMVASKVYVTGGIGAHAANEGFGSAYDLPIDSGYSETCASIASAMWSHRLFLATGDARYMDLVERVIYNAFHSGWSLAGDRFFYPNPLASSGAERRPWFACACCPPNVCRFVASIAGYAYAVQEPSGDAAPGGPSPGRVFVSLFMGGRAELSVGGGTLAIEQRTGYPWDGDVAITTHPEQPIECEIRVRLPGWARGEPLPGGLYRFVGEAPEAPLVWVNGERVRPMVDRGYAVLPGRWSDGDTILIRFPMPPRWVGADERVEACRSRLALQRGPLVYCVEGVDNSGIDPRSMVLDGPRDATEAPRTLTGPSPLDGVKSIQITARPASRTLGAGIALGEPMPLTAIPYYAWANRGVSPMTVWLAATADAARPGPAPTVARRASATASFQTDTRLLSDQFDPPSSASHEGGHCHWWPSKGSAQWVQYDLASPTRVSGVEVYWFDDTGRGECRVPASCRAVALVRGEWIVVGEVGTAADRFNRVQFEPVIATALRLEIQSQEGWAGGVHEWRVVESTP